MQKYASSRPNLHMKLICFNISLSDWRLSILKWSGGCTDLDCLSWWKHCFPHPFSLLEIDSLQTDFLQKYFLYKLSILNPFSRDFQSPPPQQIFLLDWDEFTLATAVAGVEKQNKFDVSSQFLKYSDPLLEALNFLLSVSVFLLTKHLEVDPARIIFFTACEHKTVFLLESDMVSPWKGLFLFAYIPLCLLFQLEFQFLSLLLLF